MPLGSDTLISRREVAVSSLNLVKWSPPDTISSGWAELVELCPPLKDGDRRTERLTDITSDGLCDMRGVVVVGEITSAAEVRAVNSEWFTRWEYAESIHLLRWDRQNRRVLSLLFPCNVQGVL
jgi:hypothetical protein